jgi:hypothetical protein
MQSTTRGGYRRLPKPIRAPVATGLWADGTPTLTTTLHRK